MLAEADAAQPRLVGCVRVRPELNRAEYEYLTAFAESRRWRRPGGPYAVPDNPIAECTDPDLDLGAYTTAAEGQPGPACPWLPARGGTALVPTGVPTGLVLGPDDAAAWLAYLIAHLLGPGGLARGRPEFAEFTFDHVLRGAVAVYSGDTGCLRVVRVVDNVLSEDCPFAGFTPEPLPARGSGLAA